MEKKFTKMSGLGNTFVVFKGPLDLSESEIIGYCRQFGDKPADGLLIVSPVSEDTVRMQYWNNDGSSAEMCGNGLRCVARFAVASNFVPAGKFYAETAVGRLEVFWSGKESDEIEVQVGKATIEPQKVTLFDHEFILASIGNPHAITFVDTLSEIPIEELGPKVENDVSFPNKTNVEFVQIIDEHTIAMRVWERGCGETLACGTGMSVSALAAVTLKDLAFPVDVRVLGGVGKIWLDDSGYIRMRGPAEVIS